MKTKRSSTASPSTATRRSLYDFLNEEQNVTYRYLTVLYESDDGFWMVQFASQKSNFEAYEPSFIEAAKSVSFSA